MNISWICRISQKKIFCVGIFKVKMIVSQTCLTLSDPMDHSPPGSSVHEILQARTLEWGGIPSFRESSQPRDWTWVSCIGRWILYCLSHQGSPQYITLIPSTSIDFLSWEVKGEKIQFSYFQWRSKKIMNIKTLWKMNHCKSVFTIIRILPMMCPSVTKVRIRLYPYYAPVLILVKILLQVP